MPGNYEVVPGQIANGGSGPPLASDVNQYAKTLKGEGDITTLKLAPPVAAPASAGSGTAVTGTELEVGTYTYAVTYVTGIAKTDGGYVINGETEAGPTWQVTTTTGNERIDLSGLPTPPVDDVTIVAKRLYRTVVGGAQLKLVATLTTGQTTYTDQIADASLGANVPTSNTTGTFFVVTNVSSLPTAGTEGRLAVVTGTNKLYLDDGAAWVEVMLASGGRFTGTVEFTDANRRIRAIGNHLALENLSNILMLVGFTNGRILVNATFNSADSSWNRIDTAQPASQFFFDRAGDLIMYYAAAGANPITWTEGARFRFNGTRLELRSPNPVYVRTTAGAQQVIAAGQLLVGTEDTLNLPASGGHIRGALHIGGADTTIDTTPGSGSTIGALQKNASSGEFAIVSYGSGGNNYVTIYTNSGGAAAQLAATFGTNRYLTLEQNLVIKGNHLYFNAADVQPYIAYQAVNSRLLFDLPSGYHTLFLQDVKSAGDIYAQTSKKVATETKAIAFAMIF